MTGRSGRMKAKWPFVSDGNRSVRTIQFVEQLQCPFRVAARRARFKSHPRVEIGQCDRGKFVHQFVDTDRIGSRECLQALVLVIGQSDREGI